MSRSSFRRRRLLRTGGWLLCVPGSGCLAVVAVAARVPGGPLWLLLPIILAVVWHRWMKAGSGVPVLVFHSVSDDSDWLPWADGISLSSEAFERQLAAIARFGFTVVSTGELISARRQQRPLPADAVVLHLDDGYLDNWVGAYPLLARHGMRATVFVSPDFIEPGESPRPTLDDVASGSVAPRDLEWRGYLNWDELRRLEESGVVDIQAHSKDHGRVVTGPKVLGRLTAENWRRLAWVQWAEMGDCKWDWHLSTEPPCVPLGSPVGESAPALSARAWADGKIESAVAFDTRVHHDLAFCRSVLGARLDKDIEFFCWPQHEFCERGRELAAEAGYQATMTGDLGQNGPEDDPQLICRVHAGDRSLGFRWAWADEVTLYAKLRVGQGNLYWFVFLLLTYLVKRVVRRLRGANPGSASPNGRRR